MHPRMCVCVRLLSFTHIADGGQFLSRVALFQQRPGVLGRIAAVVVHREFGAHEVGPDGEQIGVETPTNDVHLSTAGRIYDRESKSTELTMLITKSENCCRSDICQLMQLVVICVTQFKTKYRCDGLHNKPDALMVRYNYPQKLEFRGRNDVTFK